MTRREWLRTASGAPFFLRHGLSKSSRRPNLIVIMADDMGFSDLGCFGGEIATPNLDRLAQRGVRFTQFYNTARCCPSRASLLTGLYSHQAGVGHMIQDRGFPGYRGYLNDRCVTIAEALRPAGYHTLMSGKWHVGEERPHWPTDRGFERYFGLISGADHYFRPQRTMALEDARWRPRADEPFYMTNAFTDYALARIDEYAPKPDPFFLYLAYTAPHWPLHALPEDIAKYRGRYQQGWDKLRVERHQRQIRAGIVDRRWPLTPRDPQAPAWESVTDPDQRDLRMAVYAAQVDRLDRNIGRVFDKLRQTGIEQNTMILFLADNGGCAEERINGETLKGEIGGPDSFTSYGLPWANASNTPFRLYKHWVHEGGIAAPTIGYWPGHTKGNTLHHQPAHIIDIMATCVDLAQAEYPKKLGDREILPMEGVSLVPTLAGRNRRPHPGGLYWEHEGNRAVRQDKWKLVSRSTGEWELYDMDADRTEMHNRAADEPQRVAALRKDWQAWADRCGVVPFRDLRPAAKK